MSLLIHLALVSVRNEELPAALFQREYWDAQLEADMEFRAAPPPVTNSKLMSRDQIRDAIQKYRAAREAVRHPSDQLAMSLGFMFCYRHLSILDILPFEPIVCVTFRVK